MARKERCNHAYGLDMIRCAECGSQIAARCPACSYEGRNDDHAYRCSQALRPGRPRGAQPPERPRGTAPVR